MILALIALVIIISVALIVKVIRDIAADLRGLDEDSRKHADTIREIEKWRSGK